MPGRKVEEGPARHFAALGPVMAKAEQRHHAVRGSVAGRSRCRRCARRWWPARRPRGRRRAMRSGPRRTTVKSEVPPPMSTISTSDSRSTRRSIVEGRRDRLVAGTDTSPKPGCFAASPQGAFGQSIALRIVVDEAHRPADHDAARLRAKMLARRGCRSSDRNRVMMSSKLHQLVEDLRSAPA